MEGVLEPVAPIEKRPSDEQPEGEEPAKRTRLDTTQHELTETTPLKSPPHSTEINSTIITDDSTIMHNGVPIPKDSAFFATVDVPQRTELSPLELLKANLASLPLTLQADDTLPIRVQFAINSIPLLDNVSTQLLRLIGVGPYEETLAMVTNEDLTPEGIIYRELVTLFEQVKKIYSEEDPFLDLKHIVEDADVFAMEGQTNLKDVEDSVYSALRKANLATFLLATLGSIDVGFFYLNESFLDVFCPSTLNTWFKAGKMGTAPSVIAGKLLKAQAGLFLELKTQAYISAIETGDRTKEEILDDIFPEHMDSVFLDRRHSTQLTPAEQDFIVRCHSRRETLMTTPEDEDLSENYDWLIFLKELFNYVSKNIGSLLWGRKGRNTFLARFTDIGVDNPGIPASLSSLSKEEIQARLEEKRKEAEERDRLDIEARDTRTTTDNASASTGSASNTTANKTATTTSGPPRLRNIMRRPWTAEEEAALIEALKDYGPHWAKILEYYGPGGKVNEALKGRTQVQLKDKARNWKMSYLKNGNPVPIYLQKVTGELDRDEKVASARRRQRQKSSMMRQGHRPVTKSLGDAAAEKEKVTETAAAPTAATAESA